MSKTKPKPVVAVQKENPKNRKLYLARLAAEGVQSEPIVSETKPIRQFQLAHLAATLAKGADADNGASEISAKAMQVWNAAGKTLVIAAQTDVLVKGLLILDRKDWEIHANALIRSMDDLDGAVLGQNPTEQRNQSREKARAKAGLAICQAWRLGPDIENVLKCWFPGKAETADSRANKLVALIQFAKMVAEKSDELHWDAPDGDWLKSSMLSTWSPLALANDASISMPVRIVKHIFTTPAQAKSDVALGWFPLLARWLTVMRQDQLTKAKQRP